MSKPTKHIGVSPLTGRVFLGRVNKAGTAFLDGNAHVYGNAWVYGDGLIF